MRRPRRNNNKNKSSATRRQGSTAMVDAIYRIPIFQSSKRVTLRYCEFDLSIVSTAGAAAGYVFSANGMFDPNITGTGHQPMGFDQMMVFYEQATVVGSKCSVVMNNNSAAGKYGWTGLYVSPDTSTLTDPARAIENGMIDNRWITPAAQAGSLSRLNIGVDLRTYFGRSRTVRDLLDDDQLFTTAAANPVEQLYFILTAVDPTGAAGTINVTFQVVIEYDAIFFEPRKITSS